MNPLELAASAEQRREWHDHGPAEGHREAHCPDQGSPYWKTGYNLAYAGSFHATSSFDPIMSHTAAFSRWTRLNAPRQ